jgi:hypothetical protein
MDSPFPRHDDALAVLRDCENAARRRTDFSHRQPSNTALGTDPYAIRALGVRGPTAPAPDSPARFVGILRGRSVLTELDASLREVARLPAPESPTGLAVTEGGEVFVVGELSRRVARYARVRGALVQTGSIELPDVRAMRDVATGPEGVVYVVEEHDGRLLTLRPGPADRPSEPAERADSPPCHGPIHVMRTRRAVLVDCLLDHAVVVRAVDGRGFPTPDGETRIVHDGPMWGFDALDDGDGLIVAVGGVEDHPLDRTQGSFAYIDSFVTLYRVADGAVVKLTEVNTAAFGVVTPKAVRLSRGGPRLELAVAGYASDRMALLDWEDAWRVADRKGPVGPVGPLGAPTVTTRPVPPGVASMERMSDGSFVMSDPLLDAWVRSGTGASDVVHVDDERSRVRSADSRIGEALFFTTLMAPWNTSDGRMSRFTCETCHWEGYVDGRTHFTGRADVHATTKPLLGLFSNRPHFSRALDPDLATMVDNEFRVASAKSGHDPWFSLSIADFPWVREIGPPAEHLAPEGLRRALMAFFMDFTHRPNPSIVGRTRWVDTERKGAAVFRDRCETCHESRLVADDPSTRVPFERWEGQVFSPEGAIVWAHAGYERTGVEPYVSEHGARVVSLRRLYKKYPYFTNGSAKSLRDVLDRVRFLDGRFFHDGAPLGAVPLGDDDKADLAAFLDLL